MSDTASTHTRRAPADLERQLEAHRRDLTGFCYRMLGSGSEAEDAVQEAMVRAWQGIAGFEGRASLRSWLYRIATNVCLDMRPQPQRRARPMDLGPAGDAHAVLAPGLPEATWVQPIADAKVLPHGGDPAEVAQARDTVRLAFIAALQHLPARQRAALILCEVLRWQAAEVAELLDTSVASVNSALQRARATLDSLDLTAPPAPVDAAQRALLARYVDAFERYDMESLVKLLHHDVQFSMPPFEMWLQGPTQVTSFMVGTGIGCKGSRLVATAANGCDAFGSYKPSAPGVREPWALQVLEVSADGLITGLHNFLSPQLFAEFGLPPRLVDQPGE